MEKLTHIQRIENAIACKSVDRTAYQNLDGGLIGKWICDEFQVGDMYLRPEWAMDKIIEAGKKMGGDTAPVYFYGPIMAMDFTGVYYKTPGKELPSDTCFEAIETNPLKDECIDFILENGVQAYIDKYVVPNWPEWAFEEGEKGGMLAETYAQKCIESGEDWYTMPICNYGGPLFYSLSRGYLKYLKDMRKFPEKVKKITQMFNDWELESNKAMMAEMGGLQFIYPAAARFDDNTISQEKFDEFVWPYFKQLADKAKEENLYFGMHIDGDFTNSIGKHIRELPQGRTVVQTDGFSNIDSWADEMVKNKICYMGDIKAANFVLGEPQEVYDRIIHLKRLFGPGLILYSGCGTPFNTKFENIQAYIEAANTNNY